MFYKTNHFGFCNVIFVHFCNKTSRVFAKNCANFRTTGWGFWGKMPVVQLAVGFGIRCSTPRGI